MKIAIVGSGIAGLAAAYYLDPLHDVTLFEAAGRLGGHAHTVDVELDGERHAVDSAFVVFNDRTYPNFMRLLDELGVASRHTTMSFSVCDTRTGLEYNGHSLNTLFAQRRNLLSLRFYRMLADVLRFNREARSLAYQRQSVATVGEFLKVQHFSRGFVDHYFLPMGAAIWSCPAGTFARFPIRFVCEFFQNHGLLDLTDRPTWRTVEGGSRTYVESIARRLRATVRLAAPIERVNRLIDGVHVHSQGRPAELFDHVIFACHADQALALLRGEATATERAVLGAFPYQRNTAVLHTDVSLLPRARRAWACWNARLTNDPAEPPITTYNLNMLQGLHSANTFCVTLNADESIDRRRVLRTFEFDHPVFTVQRDAAQSRHADLLNVNRTSYCGAYWRNGFHEDGVWSALAVVEALRGASTKTSVGSPAVGIEPLAEAST